MGNFEYSGTIGFGAADIAAVNAMLTKAILCRIEDDDFMVFYGL
jgi:hypothetical protein